jgi:heat shock protein HslJ
MECAHTYRREPCLLLLLLVFLLLDRHYVSFAAEGEATGKVMSTSTAPTRAELENAAYSGFDGSEEIKGSVRLSGGTWEGTACSEGGAARLVLTLLGDFIIAGDVDSDGSDEAVTLLNLSTGGTGQFLYLAVVSRRDGGLRNIATTFVGDRVQVRGGTLKDRSIALDIVRAGPSDPACCPGEVVTVGWVLEPGGVLRAVAPADKPGRLSLQTLAATEWVLRKWRWNESAPAEPEVTIRYRNGQFSGSGGCNRYFAATSEGDMSGDISVGQIGATRMSCNEQAMAVERRFFSQLRSAKKFGFMLGRLALTYQGEGTQEVMLFDELRRGNAIIMHHKQNSGSYHLVCRGAQNTEHLVPRQKLSSPTCAKGTNRPYGC